MTMNERLVSSAPIINSVLFMFMFVFFAFLLNYLEMAIWLSTVQCVALLIISGYLIKIDHNLRFIAYEIKEKKDKKLYQQLVLKKSK